MKERRTLLQRARDVLLRDRVSRLIDEFIEDRNETRRLAVIRELCELGNARAIEALAAFADAELHYATPALKWLVALRGELAEEAVATFVESPHTDLAIRACRYLADEGSADSLNRLALVCEPARAHWELKYSAQNAIARIHARGGDGPGVGKLRKDAEGRVSLATSSEAGAVSLGADAGALSDPKE